MDAETVAVDGEWIRHAPHRSSLLGRASEATDGRWQQGDVVRALLYLADEPATTIAEWYRLLAERGLPPGRAIPHDHHVWQLDLQLADLSTADRGYGTTRSRGRSSRAELLAGTRGAGLPRDDDHSVGGINDRLVLLIPPNAVVLVVS
jgi:hypothetical protein